ERGSQVTAGLAGPDSSAGSVLPDLAGLPAREALRRLSLCQVPVRIEGTGAVVRQEPAPGTPLPLRGPCRLWCSTTRAAAAGHPAKPGPAAEPAGPPVALALATLRAAAAP